MNQLKITSRITYHRILIRNIAINKSFRQTAVTQH